MTSIIDHYLQVKKPSQSPTREATPQPHSENNDIPNPAGDHGVPSGDLQTTPVRAFAFFYCRRADAERRKPENILRSFLKQLALSRDKSLASLRTKYLEKKGGGFLSNALSSIECQELLIKMASIFPENSFGLGRSG